jgi:hypothetical protein
MTFVDVGHGDRHVIMMTTVFTALRPQPNAALTGSVSSTRSILPNRCVFDPQ